jgi:hypothetical protein
MTRIVWLSVIVMVIPAFLDAGPIYGVILFNARALGGASIRIDCPNAPPSTGPTLSDGSYRVPVKALGRCTFTATGGGLPGPARTEVVSLQDAVQYNFTVVAVDGRFELRRK